MPNGFDAYRQTATTSMTRVEMLVALYDKTTRTLEEGIDALGADDIERFRECQQTIYKCLLLLLDGLNPELGEIPENIQQLCVFTLQLVTQSSAVNWRQALKVLRPIHQAFEQIREEGIEMELRGEIPPLESTSRPDPFLV